MLYIDGKQLAMYFGCGVLFMSAAYLSVGNFNNRYCAPHYRLQRMAKYSEQR